MLHEIDILDVTVCYLCASCRVSFFQGISNSCAAITLNSYDGCQNSSRIQQLHHC